MLPPHQMEELYRLHPAAPWSITYFPSGSWVLLMMQMGRAEEMIGG
jgi:hypothetical protein